MIKFSRRQLDRFNDTVQNILENEDCRKVLEKYLVEVRKRNMVKVIKLWLKADNSLKSNQEVDKEILDMMDEIDDLDDNELQGNNIDKLNTIKHRCEDCIKKIHRRFIDYLEDKHHK